MHLAHADDLRRGREFLVIAVVLFSIYVEALEERDSRVHLIVHLPGKPDFVVDARLLEDKPRAFVNASQDQAYGNGIEGLHIQLREL